MIPIFIASNRSFTGKTFLVLGLAQRLIEMGCKVGYMKPLGKTPVKKGREVYDADAMIVQEALGLSDPLRLISPFVLSYETQNLMFEGRLRDTRERVMEAFAAQKDKDYLIIGGAGDFFEGSVLTIDALTLIREMDARVIMVEAWRGDKSIDALVGPCKLLGERFIGGVVNKTPANTLPYVRDTIRPFLEREGVPILSIIKKDSVLESFTVKELSELLNGKVLCCEDRLDEPVENFSIGAMDVESALKHFRKIPNKAVITGANRSDIQLVAMETSTRCIILTGGLYPNDVVLGKAISNGIPMISVGMDTFTTVDRIEAIMGRTRITEKSKITRAKEIIDQEFDMERFLKIAQTPLGYERR
ncbi:MAG: phosphotransacetylase family protein [Nitrospirota bacterium]